MLLTNLNVKRELGVESAVPVLMGWAEAGRWVAGALRPALQKEAPGSVRLLSQKTEVEK